MRKILKNLHFCLKHQSGMLTQRMKLDLRPLLLDGAQGGAVVNQQRRRIDRIERDPVRVGIHEFFQFVRVVARHPARQVEIAAQDARLHAIVVLQPVRHDLELQLSDRAQ